MLRRSTVLVLLCLAVPGCFGRGERQRPDATPRAELTTTAGDLRIFPEASDEVRGRITTEINELLGRLYRRGFLPAAAPRTSPTPSPAPLQELFTEQAGVAATASIAAFQAQPDERVSRGTVTFDGVVTVEQDAGVSGLLTVQLSANGSLAPPSGASRSLRLTQTGQLYVVHTDAGWRIGGFDLKLDVETRGTSSSPQAAARWMPA